MEYIYVLALSHGKYFVGMTKDVKADYAKHSFGDFEWTVKYSPKRLIAVHPYDNSVRKYTDAYAKIYGADNVMGYWPGEFDFESDRKVDLTRMVCHNCKTSEHSFLVCKKTKNTYVKCSIL